MDIFSFCPPHQCRRSVAPIPTNRSTPLEHASQAVGTGAVKTGACGKIQRRGPIVVAKNPPAGARASLEGETMSLRGFPRRVRPSLRAPSIARDPPLLLGAAEWGRILLLSLIMGLKKQQRSPVRGKSWPHSRLLSATSYFSKFLESGPLIGPAVGCQDVPLLPRPWRLAREASERGGTVLGGDRKETKVKGF